MSDVRLKVQAEADAASLFGKHSAEMVALLSSRSTPDQRTAALKVIIAAAWSLGWDACYETVLEVAAEAQGVKAGPIQ